MKGDGSELHFDKEAIWARRCNFYYIYLEPRFWTKKCFIMVIIQIVQTDLS